jgi:hypothetical protein
MRYLSKVNWKGCSKNCPNLRFYLIICLEEFKKITELGYVVSSSRIKSPGPVYEAEVLTTALSHYVQFNPLLM